MIEIVFSTFLITISAVYSRAWSIGGVGLEINNWVVAGFNLFLIVGGILAYFFLNVLIIAVDVLSWILGIAGVWLCANETIFLFNCIPWIKLTLIKNKYFTIRILEVLSLIVSLGINLGWWFSYKNWIINDIVSICIIVGSIKFFKFVSLKQALICFVVTMSV